MRTIRETLAQLGLRLHDTDEATRKLAAFRKMYEPYVYALAMYLGHTLPPWITPQKGKDNWQTTAWAKSAGVIVEKPDTVTVDDHF